MSRRQLLVRHIEREAHLLRERFREARERLRRRQRRPCGERAVAQTGSRIANEQRRIRPLLRAESLAHGAPAERTIEREVMRIQRLEASATLIAGEVLTVAVDLPARLLAGII